MPNFTNAELNTSVSHMVQGSYTAARFLSTANRAVRDILAELDLRSSKRSVALSPNLFDDVYHYTCPTDIKGNKIIDIQPQVSRNRFDEWTLTTQEEFDRRKQTGRFDKYGDQINIANSAWSGDNLVAISRDDLVNKLLLSRPIDDTKLVVSTLDSVGDWTLYGDGTNVTVDTTNYVKGNASINWDISAAGGTTAGIYNSSLDTFDITPYTSLGYAFAWVYITSKTDLTNFILRIGSSSSAYYSITITTNNEGVAFYNGWNLLRFDFSDATETGTVDKDGCDYVALYMTKDAGKTSETDYRFDNLTLRIGDHYNTVYYSRYFWQSSTGTYLEDATATTDVLNAETDEIGLVEEKIAQYIEQSLGNSKEEDKHEQRYEIKRARYIMENPSQALLLQTTYYDL